VEVHLVGVPSVDARLGVGEEAERGERPLAHRTGQVRRVQQGPDLRPGAVRVVLGGARDVHLERAQTGPAHHARAHLDLAGHHRRDRRTHHVQHGARVQQRSEQHVARDAPARIDPQVPPDAHGPTLEVRPHRSRSAVSSGQARWSSRCQ
jgi:hypothetical protein